MAFVPEIKTADDFVVVTPSDTVDLTTPARALYVGVAGNLVCLNKRREAITFVGVPAGAVLPIETIRVNSTSTTAGSILALY